MKRLLVLLCFSPSLLFSQTEGAPGTLRLEGRLVSPKDAEARSLKLDSLSQSNIREGNRPRHEEEEDWWDRLSAEDRKYIAKGEYQDPWALIAARKRQEEYGRQAREALAQGKPLPLSPKPFDPSVGHSITPVFSNPLQGQTEQPPHLPSLLQNLWPESVRAPTWYTSWSGFSDSWRPSDSVAAVGPAHVGVMVNSKLAFYTKDGTAVVGPLSLAAWWPDAPHAGDLYDPKIVYDVHAGRWIMLALNGRNGDAETYFALSVSQTSNPELGWWNYYLRSDIDGGTDTSNWADYPGLGFDSGNMTNTTAGGAVYIASNQYAGETFQRGKIRILPKYQLYTNSGCCSWYDFWNSGVFTWKPAATYSSTGATPTEYLINTTSIGGTSFSKWTLTNPLGIGSSPSLSSVTIGTGLYGAPPAAEQPGGYKHDTGDCRTQDVQYRNGYLYVTAGDFSFWSDLFDTDAVVHYWKLNVSNNSLVWDSYFGSNDHSFAYGKVIVDASDNATFVFSHTSPGHYPEIGVTGRTPADGSIQSYFVLKAGEAVFNPTSDEVERWGDYNGMGIDCAGDESGVWSMSQYARSDGWWQTWIGGSSFVSPNVWHLSDNASVSSSTAPRSFTWKMESFDWSGVALSNPGGGDNDLAASSTCPFGTPYQNSTYGGATREFILTNGTTNGEGYHHARAVNYSGSVSLIVQARTSSVDVSVGQTASNVLAASELLDVFEAYLTSGKTYAAVLDITDGTADLGIWAFKGSRTSGRRSDYDAYAQSAGAGLDETLVFTATETSTYGFAVLNDNSGASNYTLRIWLKPSVNTISNATIFTGGAYTGATPSLAEGTTPVTWSLASSPAGMTISSTTGVVSWPAPTAGVHTIITRATNPAGYSEASWTLTVLQSTTVTPTVTRTPTLTFTPTRTQTPSSTPTTIPASTLTPTPTSFAPTATPTPSSPPSLTATPTQQATASSTPTQTPSDTPTPTQPQPTPTDRPFATKTPTPILPTATSTHTPLQERPTDTPTQTAWPTKTSTPSPTPTSVLLGNESPPAFLLVSLALLCLAWLSGAVSKPEINANAGKDGNQKERQKPPA